MRTLPVFFGVLELLLRAGVTSVAEAAFQDKVWRPHLEPLRDLAQIRIDRVSVGRRGSRWTPRTVIGLAWGRSWRSRPPV